MSYDIQLIDQDTGQIIFFDEPMFTEGGTYVVGGSHYATLNITYNYAEHFYNLFGDKGIRSFYGMTARESIPHLQEGLAVLGNDVSDDYWEPTEGNAKRALIQMLSLALMAPNAIWDGD